MQGLARAALLTLAALVLMGGSFAVASLARSWWGGGGGEGVDSPRAQDMSAFIEAAANKYAEGASSFYDLISVFVKPTCSRESFVNSVSSLPVPTTFKKLEDVSFDGERAKAKILFVTNEGDKTIEWDLIKLSGTTWRIEHVPGMENCTP